MKIPNPPTPTWLTDVLRQSGWLRQGAGTVVEEQTSGAFNSQLSFLRLVAEFRDWQCEALL